jgi:ketosteroid isomerase-like protein
MSIEPTLGTALDTFEKFVMAINRHDIEALTSLMTADHLFVDSLGNQVSGAKSMRVGWQGYLALCPNYVITIRKALSDAHTVMATGEAGGTIDNTAWHTPAAWQATIRDDLVAEWHVFADNKPVYDILARRPR